MISKGIRAGTWDLWGSTPDSLIAESVPLTTVFNYSKSLTCKVKTKKCREGQVYVESQGKYQNRFNAQCKENQLCGNRGKEGFKDRYRFIS